ncbi:hypothetical protein JCM10212_006741 [Sporobolomyces blumeae]
MASVEQKTNLNVRDALSYLDRVKVTFAEQTEVYDRFLTIMKEFKSQGIDTPGVIDRVSTLFRGHPALIQGFNTFLPPGYRIECSIDNSAAGGGSGSGGPDGEKGITTITVTTPMGMTTRTQVTGPEGPASATEPSQLAPGRTAPGSEPQVKQESGQPPAPSVGGAAPSNLRIQNLPPTPAVASMQASAASTPIATPGAASVLSSQLASANGAASSQPSSSASGVPAAAPSTAAASPAPSAAGDAARPPMEFNHAINYVNKIKNRFLKEPDTYKAFLEILQTYQKEGRAIQDVYAQVTILFRDAPDLLDEFKQFLPDTSAGAQQQPPQPAPPAPTPVAAPPASTGTGRGAAKRAAPGAAKEGATTAAKRTKTSSKAGTDGGKAATGPGKGKRKADAPLKDGAASGRATKGQSPADPLAMYHSDSPSVAGDAYSAASAAAAAAAAHHAQAHAQAQAQAYYGGVAPHVHGSGSTNASAAAYAGGPGAGTSVPYGYETPLPAPPPQPLLVPKPVASPPDLAFFQRVKTHTKDQSVYFEFLKLVNLYTQDLIDLTALVARAWLFLHQDETLWAEFRELVGWTEGDAVGDPGRRVEVVDGKRVVENVPRMDGEGWRKSKLDAGKDWETYGPSYRKLPKEEISLSCSGRDALCWEVLNDEWVSQPSFASDEGFVANRKNPYEEALHRSEEERHEYDYHIEANLRTITLLEPIASRIAMMDPDERAVFRLKPGLGNQNKSIYQRVIKRVYGKEQGLEVIQALHENPCVAVPIVLARLKQKDDEWKRALREWNRVWRESDAKNFWKALDHQAISLKANDKRFLSSKALVSEIESLKREQNQRATGGARRQSPPRFQLSFDVADRRAFYDAARLVFSFVDRTHLVTYADKPRIEAILRDIFALSFAISPEEFSLELLAGTNDSDDVDSNFDSASEAGGPNALGAQSLDEAVEAALASSAIGRKGKKGGDLRKKALRKSVPDKPGRGGRGRFGAAPSSAPSSRGNSPAPSGTGGETDSVMNEATPGPEGFGGEPMSREGSVDTSVAGGETGDVTPVLDSSETFASNGPRPSVPDVILPVEDKPPKLHERKTWNLFANSTLYVLLRYFQVLYHRLTLLRNSTVTLALPPPPEPITPAHVPSLSLSLSLAPANGERWTATAEYYYQRALALCEKFFEGELDQPAFEDSIRKILATQGYMLFTMDKLVTSIVRQAQSIVADSKSKELLDLLRQDRAHPERSTHSQQLAYRQHAESALGSDENLYRLEWVPETRTLSFQLVGKDTVGPEDVPALEKEWAKYVDAYVKHDRTPGLSTEPTMPFLPRNLRLVRPADGALPKDLTAVSALQSKICMRSYKLFFSAETEDVLIRHRHDPSFTPVEVRDQRVMRCSEWMDQRTDELDLLAEGKEQGQAHDAKAGDGKVSELTTTAPEATAGVEEKKDGDEDVEMQA